MFRILATVLCFVFLALKALAELPPDVIITDKFLDPALVDQLKADRVYSVWVGNPEVHELIAVHGADGYLIKKVNQMTQPMYQHSPTDEGDGSVYLVTVDFIKEVNGRKKHRNAWFLTQIDSFGFFGVSIVNPANMNVISKTISCNRRQPVSKTICDKLAMF